MTQTQPYLRESNQRYSRSYQLRSHKKWTKFELAMTPKCSDIIQQHHQTPCKSMLRQPLSDSMFLLTDTPGCDNHTIQSKSARPTLNKSASKQSPSDPMFLPTGTPGYNNNHSIQSQSAHQTSNKSISKQSPSDPMFLPTDTPGYSNHTIQSQSVHQTPHKSTLKQSPSDSMFLLTDTPGFNKHTIPSLSVHQTPHKSMLKQSPQSMILLELFLTIVDITIIKLMLRFRRLSLRPSAEELEAKNILHSRSWFSSIPVFLVRFSRLKF